jgi:hypothetical protein
MRIGRLLAAPILAAGLAIGASAAPVVAAAAPAAVHVADSGTSSGTDMYHHA